MGGGRWAVGDALWTRQHLESQAQSRPHIHGSSPQMPNASACSGRGSGRGSVRACPCPCCCVPGHAAPRVCSCARTSSSVPGDRARPPVTVGELRSRCAHTFVPVRLLSVGVGGRAACISACVWTRAAPRRDAVLVHLGGHCEGACHCGPGRGGRAGGGRTPVSARRIWTHGWGATGVGVAGGSSWPVTSVAVSRSPAQVGAGISSHLYHGRGGGWA